MARVLGRLCDLYIVHGFLLFTATWASKPFISFDTNTWNTYSHLLFFVPLIPKPTRKKLGSLAAQEVALWWGVKGQLDKLSCIVKRSKAVLDAADEQAQQSNQVKDDWLRKLQEPTYDHA